MNEWPTVVLCIHTDARNCEDVYVRGLTLNGTYRVFNDDRTSYLVFCQFNPDRTGLAFPANLAVELGQVNFDVLWTNRTYVGIYVWHADGHEYATFVRPLANEESTVQLTVNTSWNAASTSVDNAAGPYIYVAINDPQVTATASIPTAGYSK